MDKDKKHLIVGNDKRKLRTLLDHIIAGSGWPVAGIRGVPVSDVAHGPHTGYLLQDLGSGEEALAASMDFSGPPMVEKFGVDTAAIDYIVSACRRQLLESRLVIIDEIGPIELSSDLFYTWVVEVLEGLSPVVAIVDRPYLSTYARFGRVHEVRNDTDLEAVQDAILIAVQP
ncbi:MAG: nucleoside-triphosphatase [Acidithiobacillus sp.]